MPEATTGATVGTISLDLRIINTLQQQLDLIAKTAGRPAANVGEAVSQAISKPLSGIDKAVEEPLKRVKRQTEQTVQKMDQDLDAVITRAVDRYNHKADSVLESAEPRVVPRKQTRLASDPGDFMTRFDAAVAAGESLGEAIDQARRKLDQLPQAAEAAEEQVSRSADKARDQVEKAGEQAKKTTVSVGRTVQRSVDHTVDRARRKTSSGFSGIQKGAHRLGRSIASALKSTFLMAGLYALFRGLRSLMAAAGQDNKEFTKSLNAVKLNLSSAFMPIVQSVMPALNRLMTGLAGATRAVSAFISALFGKTYQQSAEAAKKLSAVQGQAAKAKGQLAGFDELNVIGAEDAAGAGENSSAAAEIDSAGAEQAITLAERLKAGFSAAGLAFYDYIVRPIQENLSKLSGPVEQFKALFQGIGAQCREWMAPLSRWFQTDFKDALSNGISNAMTRLSGLMGTLAMVGNTIWNYLKEPINWVVTKGLPMFTSMWVQLDNTITDVFLALKGVVDTVWKDAVEPFFLFVSSAWTDVMTVLSGLWDEYGESTFAKIQEAVQNISDSWRLYWDSVWKPIFDKVFAVLGELWTNHMLPLIQQIGVFVAKFVNAAVDIYNKFISPIVQWFVKMLGPKISYIIQFVIDIIGIFLTTAIDKAKGIIRAFTGIVDFLKDVFTGHWENVWNDVKEIFGGIFDSIIAEFKGAINIAITLTNTFIDWLNSKMRFEWDDFTIMGKTIVEAGSIQLFTIPHIPMLAKGGIIEQPTLAMMGEYSGARNNPEIVSPQSIMRETFLESLVPLMNALEQGFTRVVEAVDRKDLDVSVDGTSLARTLKPYSAREDARVGGALFQR